MKTKIAGGSLRRTASALAVLIVAGLAPQEAMAGVYDPLARLTGVKVRHTELDIHDRLRKRDIPVRIYLPSTESAAPVILFSHGLGGSREGSTYLGRHWAARGYAAVFVQHPGSDDSVWRDQAPAKRMAAMKHAANGRNFLLRVRDVPAVLNQLQIWNGQAKHPLSGRLDLSRIGMSGHSFGARTTQAVSGQAFGRLGRLFTDDRIQAALIFSPSSPNAGSAAAAFGSVRIPWMLMTGTHDTAPIGTADLESRLAVFPNLPRGDKYELVLHKAEHSAFTERSLRGDRLPRNPNHHRVILGLSTAFWDAYLRDNRAAQRWLQQTGPRALLEEKDRWQCK